MERRQEVQQEPVYKYDENNSRWLKGVELPDGKFYVEEVDEAEVPDDAFGQVETPAFNAAPTESGFELNIRAYGPVHELHGVMSNFGARITSDYAQSALEAPITAPTPVRFNPAATPAPIPEYSPDDMDLDDEWQDDDMLPEMDATLLQPAHEQQQISWNGVDDGVDKKPVQRRIERVGKPRSRKGIVAIAFLATGLVIGLDGAHAVGQAAADMARTSNCPVGTCIPGNFVGDMLNPFGHSEPAKTTKQEKK